MTLCLTFRPWKRAEYPQAPAQKIAKEIRSRQPGFNAFHERGVTSLQIVACF